MERKDTKASGRWARNDEVVLSGSGREAELIVAGLKLLAAQIAVRDVLVTRGSGEYPYPTGTRDQGNGVPLSGEVDYLLEQIGDPNYVEDQPPVEAAAQPQATN